MYYICLFYALGLSSATRECIYICLFYMFGIVISDKRMYLYLSFLCVWECHQQQENEIIFVFFMCLGLSSATRECIYICLFNVFGIVISEKRMYLYLSFLCVWDCHQRPH